MNCWTHLVALVVVIGRAVSLSQEFNLLDRYMWPLTASLVTMVILFLCSSLAHCLQSQSELSHYTCFMVDYGGIGLYGLGSTILHFAYSSNVSLRNYPLIWTLMAPLGTFLGILCSFGCSVMKVKYTKPYPFIRRVWQILSIISVYVWLILPITHRLYCHISQGTWDAAMSHHVQHMVWFVVSGFFFSSEIPQRFFPGKCDFIGHSHQLFHICIMMVTCKQLDAVYLDIKAKGDNLFRELDPTLWNSFIPVIITFSCNAFLVLIFHLYVKYKILKHDKTA